jgi:hypothetical protein
MGGMHRKAAEAYVPLAPHAILSPPQSTPSHSLIIIILLLLLSYYSPPQLLSTHRVRSASSRTDSCWLPVSYRLNPEWTMRRMMAVRALRAVAAGRGTGMVTQNMSHLHITADKQMSRQAGRQAGRQKSATP